MSIKVFRVTIEGYVVSQDFGGPGPELTPAGWLPSQIVEAMGADISVTETLVDTIEDEEAMEVAAQAELVARSLTPEDVTRAKAEALAMAALSICGLDYEEEE